jgi:hypothetical protein
VLRVRAGVTTDGNCMLINPCSILWNIVRSSISLPCSRLLHFRSRTKPLTLVCLL